MTPLGSCSWNGRDSESWSKNLCAQNQGKLSLLILGNSDLDPFSSNFKHVICLNWGSHLLRAPGSRRTEMSPLQGLNGFGRFLIFLDSAAAQARRPLGYFLNLNTFVYR